MKPVHAVMLVAPLLMTPTFARAEEAAAGLASGGAEASALQNESFVAGGAPDDGRRRTVAIELTPLGLFVGHYGATLEIVPLAHHSLLLSGYYAHSDNQDPEFVPDAAGTTRPPTNTFYGVGGELGYRYYCGRLGPHGFYVGPSFIYGKYSGNLSVERKSIDYQKVGGALDIGYQSILGHVLLGLGVGVQYVYVTTQIPDQNDTFIAAPTMKGVRPRATATVGYAF